MIEYSKLSYEELMKIEVSDIKDYREVDMFLEVLWSEFSNIPVNEDDDTIEEPFYIWSEGTEKMDVWHWFDDKYSNGLAEGLMGLGESEDITLDVENLKDIIDKDLKDIDDKSKNTILRAIKYIFADLIIGEELINGAIRLNKSLEKYVLDNAVEFIRFKNMSIEDFWNMEDDTEFIDYIYA